MMACHLDSAEVKEDAKSEIYFVVNMLLDSVQLLSNNVETEEFINYVHSNQERFTNMKVVSAFG